MTEAEWLRSDMPILSLEADRGWPSPRKQRLFAVACCRRVEHLLPVGRWQDCLVVAERYADRRAKRDELAAVCPHPPTGPTGRTTYAHLRGRFVESAVRWACHTTLRRYAGQVATCAASAAAYSALPPNERYVPPAESRHQRLWLDTEKAEVSAQIALVDEVCGNPFRPRPVVADRSWLTADVLALARGMYASGDFSAVPILADALQDAGCDSAEVLDHCRRPGEHVRGCWAVDLVLGKG